MNVAPRYPGIRPPKPKERRSPKPACGRMSLRGYIPRSQELRFHRLHCKCWDCPRCAPKKAAQYKRAIRIAVERHRFCRMMTLTLDPKKLESEDIAVPYLRECWNKLRVYLRRAFGEAPDFIAVLEFQTPKPNNPGLPHLHILVDRFIDQAWLQHAWEQVGGGMHVDIRMVAMHRASRYLSKYLTKELLMSAPRRSRRVTTSRSIRLFEKKATEGEWVLLRTPIQELYRRWGSGARQVFRNPDDEVEGFVISVLRL